MLQVRKSNERGQASHGWLQSRHTFSFAEYYDPKNMGFRSLRVINEDRIEGGTGFSPHPHRDMEIISYVINGALEHKDSMGNKTIIRPGEVQKMSAGTGVVHSEYNHMPESETHFFQIWIIPNRRGTPPSYGQKSFDSQLKENNRVLVASQEGREGSISIQQDADLYLSRLPEGRSYEYLIQPGRGLWIQMVRGRLQVNSQELHTGDALAVTDETSLQFKTLEPSEWMIFDLA